MKRLPTVAAAIKEIEALQNYVRLAEEHPEKNTADKVIKIYAYTGSMKETAKIVSEEGAKLGLPIIDEAYVKTIILSRATNPLHKLLKSNYMIKSRSARLS